MSYHFYFTSKASSVIHFRIIQGYSLSWANFWVIILFYKILLQLYYYQSCFLFLFFLFMWYHYSIIFTTENLIKWRYQIHYWQVNNFLVSMKLFLHKNLFCFTRQGWFDFDLTNYFLKKKNSSFWRILMDN